MQKEKKIYCLQNLHFEEKITTFKHQNVILNNKSGNSFHSLK